MKCARKSGFHSNWPDDLAAALNRVRRDRRKRALLPGHGVGILQSVARQDADDRLGPVEPALLRQARHARHPRRGGRLAEDALCLGDPQLHGEDLLVADRLDQSARLVSSATGRRWQVSWLALKGPPV